MSIQPLAIVTPSAFSAFHSKWNRILANGVNPQLMNACYHEAKKIGIAEKDARILVNSHMPNKNRLLVNVSEDEIEKGEQTVKPAMRTLPTKSAKEQERKDEDFRRRVWNNFNGLSAITGQYMPVLESAHVNADGLFRNDDTSNGILLEPTLHRLFDEGLMGIHPINLTVHFAIDIIYKEHVEGKVIQTPNIPLDEKCLTAKWEKYKGDK